LEHIAPALSKFSVPFAPATFAATLTAAAAAAAPIPDVVSAAVIITCSAPTAADAADATLGQTMVA
jgi:hypothetical protein